MALKAVIRAITNERKLPTMKIERYHTYEDESSKPKADDSVPEIKIANTPTHSFIRLRLPEGDICYVTVYKNYFTISTPAEETRYSTDNLDPEGGFQTMDYYDTKIIKFLRQNFHFDKRELFYLGVSEEDESIKNQFPQHIRLPLSPDEKDAVERVPFKGISGIPMENRYFVLFTLMQALRIDIEKFVEWYKNML